MSTSHEHEACETAEFLAHRIVQLIDADRLASGAVDLLRVQRRTSDVGALREALLILARSCEVAEIDEKVEDEVASLDDELLRELG